MYVVSRGVWDGCAKDYQTAIRKLRSELGKGSGREENGPSGISNSSD